MSARKEPLVRVWLADVVHSVRALVATPRYSLPALLSLALGIGASTAVFAIFSALVLRPLPFPNESELVTVVIKWASSDQDYGLSAPYAEELTDMHSVFASFAGYKETEVTMTGRGEARRALAAMVTPEFFDTLKPEVEVGRTFSARGAARDPADVAVLSHSYWLSAFGGEPVTGQTVLLDGAPKTIVGVIADDGALPAHRDVWVPIQFSEDEKEGRFLGALHAIGRLNPGTSIEAARPRLRAETEAQNIRSPDGTIAYASISPLRENLVGDTRKSVSLMLAAVGAFLSLACANVAALLVTRASVRARDLAVRAALGASPTTLARQSGLEALLLTVAGSGAGLALSVALVRAANLTYASELAYTPARLDARVLAAFVVLALASAIVVGIAPGLHALRVRPMDSLRAEGRSSSGRGARRLRELLVALQVAATVVLLVSAVVLMRSVHRMHAVDPGFDVSTVAARVLYAPSKKSDPERTTAFARAVLERAEHLPGVTSAAIARDVPFDDNTISMGALLEPGSKATRGYAKVHVVSSTYFRTMEIGVLAGRAFTDADNGSGRKVAIVSRAFATQLLGTDGVPGALGKRLDLSKYPDGTGWFEIVGVVEDTLDVTVTSPSEPAMYFPFTTDFEFLGAGFTVLARGPGDPNALLETLSKGVREVDRDAPLFDVNVLGAMVTRSYRQRTSLEQLLGAFAIASVLLAAIGLFGVTSYTVAERSGEIGIRRALGATRGDVLLMILRETFAVVAIGIAGGLACAWSARSLLASFLYGVAASDPATYVSVCAGTFVIATLAALVPARVAAAVTPSRALAIR